MKKRLPAVLATAALALGLALGGAASAQAATRFLADLTCGWGWVHVTSTASGDVHHFVKADPIAPTLVTQTDIYVGSSAILTPWESGHWGQANVTGNSQVYTNGSVPSAGRYCGA